ncbi:hypothetical protein M422DRAFT_250160 [Sphaerobolus stellatus SS14]|uniref:Uncharacterized protein n=1 Tax=Sphaerobolus stellatus (strain SS14) TaxID=990650 RepID=A0A0C9UHW9_SPHS4|nr:hypothetical protein M422DRAFT_263386 [Sphaerobolus stellatus SS14]KIJ46130.1 hypothetical protein M422DRAFT_250160 [Sphaerobolus stellatus SS14]
MSPPMDPLMEEVFVNFAQDFDNFTILSGEVVNSGTFQNVSLVQGITATLGIIPLGSLDVESDVVVTVAGKKITVEGLKQNNVTTSYDIDLSEL